MLLRLNRAVKTSTFSIIKLQIIDGLIVLSFNNVATLKQVKPNLSKWQDPRSKIWLLNPQVKSQSLFLSYKWIQGKWNYWENLIDQVLIFSHIFRFHLSIIHVHIYVWKNQINMHPTCTMYFRLKYYKNMTKHFLCNSVKILENSADSKYCYLRSFYLNMNYFIIPTF